MMRGFGKAIAVLFAAPILLALAPDACASAHAGHAASSGDEAFHDMKTHSHMKTCRIVRGTKICLIGALNGSSKSGCCLKNCDTLPGGGENGLGASGGDLLAESVKKPYIEKSANMIPPESGTGESYQDSLDPRPPRV
ncbi:MAG: hypothetical protein ACNS63_13530 [Candidatus Nitrospinota bacterium M3_3B_026]